MKHFLIQTEPYYKNTTSRVVEGRRGIDQIQMFEGNTTHMKNQQADSPLLELRKPTYFIFIKSTFIDEKFLMQVMTAFFHRCTQKQQKHCAPRNYTGCKTREISRLFFPPTGRAQIAGH